MEHLLGGSWYPCLPSPFLTPPRGHCHHFAIPMSPFSFLPVLPLVHHHTVTPVARFSGDPYPWSLLSKPRGVWIHTLRVKPLRVFLTCVYLLHPVTYIFFIEIREGGERRGTTHQKGREGGGRHFFLQLAYHCGDAHGGARGYVVGVTVEGTCVQRVQ